MKKSGFTLIELLAVIVILAIIALIAVPIILSIIDDAKKSSNDRSIELFIDNLQKKVATKNLYEDFNPSICTVENSEVICGNVNLGLITEGSKISGTVTFENGKIISYDLAVGENSYISDTPVNCFVSFTPGQIDYYACENNKVLIPDNLKLPVSSVESVEFDMAKCKTYEQYLQDKGITDSCENFRDDHQNDSIQEIINSVNKPFYKITLGEKSSQKYNIEAISNATFALSNLSEVVVGEGIKYIRDYSFIFNLITDLKLPRSLISIGDYAFTNNYISSVNFKDLINLEEIGISAFHVNSLRNVDIKSLTNLKNIDLDAFSFNYLSSANIGNSVKDIGESAFVCNNITNVSIGNSIETIGQNAFGGGFVTQLEIEKNMVLMKLNL